jgi:hypothetical protein
VAKLGFRARFASSCLLTALCAVTTVGGRPAPAAAATASPSFSSRQLYAAAAPLGTGIRAAWNVPGGRGENVKIVDVEYSWNLDHEDLGTTGSTLIHNGTPTDPYHDSEHGTAVLGILHAPNNGYGITGLAPDADLHVVNSQNTETGYDLAHSLTMARAQLRAGDVLVLEQQANGPNGTDVPTEWSYDVYQQIRAATAAGIIVVEPAGNGANDVGANLDDPAFADLVTGRADSGAIMVGAGEGANCNAPARSRTDFSNYGSRVNLQGPGSCVVSTGYGDLSGEARNTFYTSGFSGTSSATAIVAGVAAVTSSVLEARTGHAPTPGEVRELLVRTGTAQNTAAGTRTGYVGPMPDVAKALGLAPVASPSPTASDVAVLGSSASRSGYWMLGADGTVHSFGRAPALGNVASQLTAGRAFGVRATKLEPVPALDGYWIVDTLGRVSAFGTARALGNATGLAAGEQVTSMSSTRSAKGYWLFTNRGRVFTFGDAKSYGDLSATHLQAPVLGSVVTAAGAGYYMVAGDGGIFAFGDATFRGSMGATHLNAPVRGLVPAADGSGYWLVASDGGVFAFDAPFRGSMGGTKLNAPVTGMVGYGDGYLMVGTDGGIFDFSDLAFAGSLVSASTAGASTTTPIVSVASAS